MRSDEKKRKRKKKRGEFFCLLFCGANQGGAAKLSAELALYRIRIDDGWCD